MVLLKMSDCMANIFKPVASKWWACRGTSATRVDICMKDTPGRCPGGECKPVRIGRTVDFSGGYKVRATGSGGMARDRTSYADVEIIPPAYAPTLPAVVGTIPIEILIPNKVSGYKTYKFDVGIPAAVPEVEIPEIRPVCTEGEKTTATCPDGTIVVTHICERDPTTGINRWIPTGRPCPAPELGKVAKILVPPDGELKAYEGMDVTITASVMCGASPSHGEPAILIIDGKEVARKNTSAGFVSFKWTATTEPARTHRVIVSVPKSDKCPMYGEARDSKTITVSRMIPGIEEPLRIEREEYQSRLEAMREERKRIREISLAARAAAAALVTPVTSVTPVTEIIPAVPVEEVELVEVPEQLPGIIEIPAVEAPPGIEYPINIFIDGVLKGPPPLTIDVDPGKHEIRVDLKNFTPLYKNVILTEGQTLSVTDMRFTL